MRSECARRLAPQTNRPASPKPSIIAASCRSYGYQAFVEKARCMKTPVRNTPTTAPKATGLARSTASGRAWPSRMPASTATSSAKASGEKPSVANTASANGIRRPRPYWSSPSATAAQAAPVRNG